MALPPFLAAVLGWAAYRIGHTKDTRGGSDDGSWVPTGRIDFVGQTGQDPDAHGKFELRAEDHRIVNSIGGLDHHEIRWRNATLREAKKVVMIYHAHANPSPTPLVAPPGSIAPEPDAAAGADMLPSRARTIAVVKART